VLLGAGEARVQVGEDLPAVGGRGHAAAAAVGRVGLALDELRGFQVVEQVGHDGALDAEALPESLSRPDNRYPAWDATATQPDTPADPAAGRGGVRGDPAPCTAPGG